MSTARSPIAQYVRYQSSKREVVGSNPAVGKNFSFCNSRFLRMDYSLNQAIHGNEP